MVDMTEKLFYSFIPDKVPKYPKEGYTYLFEWSREELKDKWKSDGYKWERSRNVKKLSDKMSKSCSYVYTSANCCSKIFMREFYFNSDFPQRVLIRYKGDSRKALHFSQSINKHETSSRSLFIRNLPSNTSEDSILSMHPCINTIKLETAKDNTHTKYALVTLECLDSAKEAKELLNNQVVNGNTISVDFLTQNLPVSCIQNSHSLSPTQDPLTLYVTGFDSSMTKRQILCLFDTCSTIKFEGLCDHNKNISDEEENSDNICVKYCYVTYKGQEEARRVHAEMQDYEDMVVMYATRS